MTKVLPRIPPVGARVSVTHERRGSSIRVRVRWTVDGRQTGTSKTFPRTPDREERMAAFIESIRMSKRERIVPRLTVAEFVEKVGSDALYEGIAPTTRSTYESAMRRHLLPLLGEGEISELNPRRVRRLAQQLPGESTKGNVLNLLSRVCRHAIDLNYLSENPVSKAEVTRSARRVHDRKILSSGDDVRLFAEIDKVSRRYGDALRVTLLCALRIGETCGLQVGDYDEERHVLRIDRQLDSAGRIRPPKWGSARSVPVGREGHSLLVRWSEGKGADAPLFGSRGGRLSVGTMRKQLGWSTLVSRVDLGGLRIHDLRHTGCSRLARHLAGAGEPVHIIRDILGHRSLATTEGYLHTVEDDMVRAAGLLWD